MLLNMVAYDSSQTDERKRALTSGAKRNFAAPFYFVCLFSGTQRSFPSQLSARTHRRRINMERLQPSQPRST